MANPICPTNCDSNLPIWSFSDCNPQINLSEIRRLFFAKTTAASFINWLDASEWMVRLNQSAVDNDDVIRSLDVIADLPAGSQVTKDISKRRKITITKDRTLNFTIDDVSQTNYDAARVLECNAQYKWWYESEGGFMFGGNDGFIANIDINEILARGADSAEELQGVLTWRSKFMPERGVSPIFDANTAGTPVTFDTEIEFTAQHSGVANGLTATVSGTEDVFNATKLFEFNALTSPTGTPFTMNIYVAGSSDEGDLELIVDAPGSFLGKIFKYTDSLGVAHNGTMAAGDINF